MKTVRELGRFLEDNHLALRVALSNDSFSVDLLSVDSVVAHGAAHTFPDAVDEALIDLVKKRYRNFVA